MTHELLGDLSYFDCVENKDRTMKINEKTNSDERYVAKVSLPPREMISIYLDRDEHAAVGSQVNDTIIHLRHEKDSFREDLCFDA